MGSTWGIQSVNMTCTRLTFILAVLIAPACSTSVGFAIKKRGSAAGCSGTDTLIYDKIQTGKGPTDGSCNEKVGDTPTAYEKTTCTANTATDGYSNGDYTDAGCTTLVAGEVLTTKPTNECVTNTGSVTEYETCLRNYKPDSGGCVLPAIQRCRLSRLKSHQCWLLCCQLLQKGLYERRLERF